MFGDFLNQLRVRGVEFQLSPSDRNEIRICCPFCSDRGESPDENYKLGLNLKKDLAHCFRCGWKSRHAVGALSRRLKMPDVSVQVEERNDDSSNKPFRIPTELERLDLHWKDSDWFRYAHNYLTVKRGMTMESIKAKRVMFAEYGKFAYRVVFPVIVGYKPVGLVGRSIVSTTTPKYLNSTGLKAIWNMPRDPHPFAILCEGIFKALAIENASEAGISVGALLGHSITETQIEQLDGVKHIFLWPDPDAVGLRGVIKVAAKLQTKFKIYLPARIPVKQADEMTEEQITHIFESGQPFSDATRCRYEFEAMRRSRNEHN